MLVTQWWKSGNTKPQPLGHTLAARKSRRRLTPTRLSTTSSRTKTRPRLPARPATSQSKASTISVSIADTLNPEPEYIVAKDPNELIHLFYQSLERRHAAIVADVEERYFPPDPEGIPHNARQRHHELDQPGAGGRVLLGPLRSQAHPQVLCPGDDTRSRGFRSGEKQSHHVH